jgi:hypothetical protein
MPYADPEKRRAYLKAWKSAHPEKVRAWQKEDRRKASSTSEGRARVRANEKRYRARHPEKIVAKNAASRKRFALSIRNSHLKKLYGITHADYEAMLESQGGGCAICESSDPGPRKVHFCVDHDHATNKVRQLLCLTCNSGLSMFKDRPELFERARLYLLKHGRVG